MILDNLKKQIADNKIENVLEILAEKLVNIDNDLLSQVILHQSRFNDTKKKVNLGLIDNGEANKNFANINYAILELIAELQKNYADKFSRGMIVSGLNTSKTEDKEHNSANGSQNIIDFNKLLDPYKIRRVKSLKEQLDIQYKLLEDYENQIILISDPQEKMKYQNKIDYLNAEIEKITKSIQKIIEQ